MRVEIDVPIEAGLVVGNVLASTPGVLVTDIMSTPEQMETFRDLLGMPASATGDEIISKVQRSIDLANLYHQE